MPATALATTAATAGENAGEASAPPPSSPPSSQELRSPRCASAATTDRRSAGVKGDASAFASLGSSVSAANPAFTAKSPVPNGEDSIVSFTLEGE